MDSFPSLAYIFKIAFKDVGVEIKDEDVPYLSRVSLTEGYYKFAKNEDLVDKYIKSVKTHLHDYEALKLTKPFDDTLRLFERIKKHNISIGLVTSNELKHVNDVMDYLHLDASIFKVIIGSDILPIIKPNPEPIFLALRKLNYKGELEDVIYIGDGLNDYKCALNAGVTPLMLDRDDTYDDTFNKIKSLDEIL